MLETCFHHLPGVGPGFAHRLRQAGIRHWQDALQQPLPCGPALADALQAGVRESMRRLAAQDIRWFGDALAPAEQWRLFPHFRHQAAYVDIETTGLSSHDGITAIALFDGASVRSYVRGKNLEAFADDILAYTLLVTWNGRGFDAPVLRRQLGVPLDKGHMAHLDLLPVFRALGLRGGLKNVEIQLGLTRNDVAGLDGRHAVLLWQEYERSADPRALETLLAYNVADVLSLESLAAYAVERRLQETGAGGGEPPRIAPVRHECNPFTPDQAVLRRVLGQHEAPSRAY